MAQHRFQAQYRGCLVAIAASIVVGLAYVVSPAPFAAVIVTMLFTIGVLISGAQGGWQPGILCTFFSIIAYCAVSAPDRGSFWPTNQGDLLGLLPYVLVGIVISVLSEALMQSWERIAERQKQIGHEIEERKRAEAESHERAERLRVTLASIADGVFVTDDHGHITFANVVAETLTGCQAESPLGRRLADVLQVVHEQTREPVENAVEQVLRDNSASVAKHSLLIARDGTERSIDEHAAPIRDSDGRLLGVVLVLRDVSRQNAEQLVRARLAALVESSEDAIIGQSFEGMITDWNAGAEHLFGYPATDVVGRTSFETIVPPDRHIELHDLLCRVKRGERPAEFETTRLHQSGRLIPVSIRVSPISNTNGDVVGMSAIDRDISRQLAAERRRTVRLEVNQILSQAQHANEAVRAIIAMLCEAFDWDVACFWQPDLHGDSLILCEYWQRSTDDPSALQATLLERPHIHGTLRSHPEERVTQCVAVRDICVNAPSQFAPLIAYGFRGALAIPVGGESYSGHLEFFSKTPFDLNDDLLELMWTISGQIGQFVTRKSAEAAVAQRDRVYQAIGDSIEFGVWVCDADGMRIYTSNSFLQLVGLSHEECLGTGWIRALIAEAQDETLRAWQQCVKSEAKWYREQSFVGTDGKQHPVLSRGVPVRDEQGAVTGWVGINLDIGRLKTVEDALRDNDRRKDEFLAMLAHELRNPLAPIRTGLDLLAINPEGQADTIELMKQQVAHLVRLVEDLLDVSRITRSKVTMHCELLDLGKLMSQSALAAQTLVQDQRHTLVVTIPPEPVYVSADSVRLMQVLGNLLNNSTKYTPAGGRIEFSLETDSRQAIIEIRDNGIGIETDLLPHIFDLFTQATRSLDRSQGGLGIGLTLVKRLVEMHKGTVEVRSDGVDQGTTFRVSLPLAERPPHEYDAPDFTLASSGRIFPRRILVVDDNRAAIHLLSTLLTELGVETVDTANNGIDALALARSTHPDIVLLDIGLPGMDGYEVGRQIRADASLDDIVLVAVTGYGHESDRLRSREIGFNSHLVKPVSVEQLLSILNPVGQAK